MTFTVEFEREDDGRWLAEVLELPGVLAYSQTSDEAISKAQALALRALADRLEHAEGAPEFLKYTLPPHEPSLSGKDTRRAAIVSPCALHGTRRKPRVIWLSTASRSRKLKRSLAIRFRILFLTLITHWKKIGLSSRVRQSRVRLSLWRIQMTEH